MLKDKLFWMIMTWGFGVYWLGDLHSESDFSLEWWIAAIFTGASGAFWGHWFSKLNVHERTENEPS